eukprot:25595-Eustigmatos_ZCMA.PRE.1
MRVHSRVVAPAAAVPGGPRMLEQTLACIPRCSSVRVNVFLLIGHAASECRMVSCIHRVSHYSSAQLAMSETHAVQHAKM